MNHYSRTSIITRRGYPADIRGSALSLYLSNTKPQARYLAQRIGSSEKTAIELCSGIGITLAELARTIRHVIGIESDPTVVRDCRANLQAWEITNAEVRLGDLRNPDTLQSLRADVVVYDIPYWNLGLTKDRFKDEISDLGELIGQVRRWITPEIVVFAPPHYSYAQATADLGPCEFEEIHRGPKHDRTYLYLGDLVRHIGRTEKTF